MKNVHIIALLFLFTLSVVPPVGARTPPLPSGIHERVTIQTNDSRSVFRQMYDLGSFSISVPTVINIPIDNAMRTKQIAVQESPSGLFMYNAVKIDNVPVPYYITSDYESPSRKPLPQGYQIGLYDNNPYTYVQYDIPSEGLHKTTWTLHYNKPVTSRKLRVTFDVNAILPKTVSLDAMVNGEYKIIIATRPINSNSAITFPETTAQEWYLTFSYDQPLSIVELGLEPSPDSTVERYTLQFLARPGSSYRLYTDPAINVPIQTEEYVSFSLSGNPLTQPLPNGLPNPFFQLPDRDNDGVVDQSDNCPSTINADQKDINQNGVGDACEDFDGDGLMNTSDNCPEHPNRVQQDSDGDGIGDQCDPDESRLTERLSWLPWMGILLGFGIVFGLLAVTMRKEQKPHHSTDEAE